MKAMRRAPVFMVLATTLACRSLTAHAGELPKGTIEVSPGLTFDRHNYSYSYGYGPYGPYTDEAQITRFRASLDLGYCLTNRFEILGGVLFDHLAVNSSSETSGGFSGGMQVNLATTGGIIPFLRAGAGVLYYSRGESTAVLAPMLGAGLRALVHSGASVNMGVEYQHETSAFGVENTSGDTFGIKLGVSIFPGSIIPTRGE